MALKIKYMTPFSFTLLREFTGTVKLYKPYFIMVKEHNNRYSILVNWTISENRYVYCIQIWMESPLHEEKNSLFHSILGQSYN